MLKFIVLMGKYIKCKFDGYTPNFVYEKNVYFKFVSMFILLFGCATTYIKQQVSVQKSSLYQVSTEIITFLKITCLWKECSYYKMKLYIYINNFSEVIF